MDLPVCEENVTSISFIYWWSVPGPLRRDRVAYSCHPAHVLHVQTAGEQVTSQHLPYEVWSTSAICAGSTRGTLMVVLVLIVLPSRVVLDSWVVSQILLDSDSNESSQSWVSYENQGYESSQSWITLIVIWVRVESTGYCLSQSCITDFS